MLSISPSLPVCVSSSVRLRGQSCIRISLFRGRLNGSVSPSEVREAATSVRPVCRLCARAPRARPARPPRGGSRARRPFPVGESQLCKLKCSARYTHADARSLLYIELRTRAQQDARPTLSQNNLCHSKALRKGSGARAHRAHRTSPVHGSSCAASSRTRRSPWRTRGR